MGNNHRAVFRKWHFSFLSSDPVR